MGHMIEEHDRGLVKGPRPTWHNMPQYEVVDGYIPIHMARGILSYDMQKVQNMRRNSAGEMVAVDSFSIVRTDLDLELASGQKGRFHLMNNDVLLDLVHDKLIAEYPQLKIESVGTFKNGAIAFVNMQVDEEYHVHGDQSGTLDRLMWYNPIGIGCYQACAHSIRIECANTLQSAAMQGAANNTLAKFTHTSGAPEAIAKYTADLAEFFLSLGNFHEMLDVLSRTGMNGDDVSGFLLDFFPAGTESGRAEALARSKREQVLEIFESGQGLDGDTTTSAYAMLNAVTHYYDHLPETDNRDAASVQWNGLVGNAATIKSKALEALVSLARRKC